MRCTIYKGDVSQKTCDCQVFAILSEFFNRVSIIDNRWIIAGYIDVCGNELSSLVIGDDYLRLNGTKHSFDYVKCIVKRCRGSEVLTLSIGYVGSDVNICIDVTKSM